MYIPRTTTHGQTFVITSFCTIHVPNLHTRSDVCEGTHSFHIIFSTHITAISCADTTRCWHCLSLCCSVPSAAYCVRTCSHVHVKLCVSFKVPIYEYNPPHNYYTWDIHVALVIHVHARVHVCIGTHIICVTCFSFCEWCLVYFLSVLKGPW